MDKKLIYCFDIDGTLCYTKDTDYGNSIPNHKIIGKVNKLYDTGHTIKIFTGRGTKSGIDWRGLTERQLREWGVRYHELIMGKPTFDVFIDNLAWNIRDFIKGNYGNDLHCWKWGVGSRG